MSLQDVEKKIVASAQAEAQEIIGKAEAEAKADLERRSAALRDEQQRALAAGKAEADAAAERDFNTRRAGHTMKVLEAKNEILNAIFGGVRDRALAAQGFDYGRWLAAQVRRVCARGVAGILYCTARDKAAVEAAVRQSGSKNVTVGPEPRHVRAPASRQRSAAREGLGHPWILRKSVTAPHVPGCRRERHPIVVQLWDTASSRTLGPEMAPSPGTFAQ